MPCKAHVSRNLILTDITRCLTDSMPSGQQLMDDRGVVLLKRKLEALNYTEPLDAASASLVSHLVNDLIRTTDSYRSIKLQAAQYAQEVATFNTKVQYSAARNCCCDAQT